MSGEANMREDAEALSAMADGSMPPTLRLFQFSEPTVTYGRLQDRDSIRALAPTGWPIARRPTGGGIVLHQKDQCFSLCWRPGTAPLPKSPKAIYGWIHRAVHEALRPLLDTRLAFCQDADSYNSAPFNKRLCFKEPVGYDLLSGDQKVLGGALAVQRSAVLYQGSLQLKDLSIPNDVLLHALQSILHD
jgi:lipoate-protein ligase A